MRILKFILLLALPAVCLSASAQSGLSLRGGLSLVNNDISKISTESVQDQDTYSGFFIGPALTMGDGLLGLDVALLYQQTKMKGYDELGQEMNYKQEFLELPHSLRVNIGFTNLSVIGQFGPQWNVNLGDVKTFMENGDEIESDKFITTGNIGAGVRLFDSLELMLNFNVPWKIIADNTDDFQKMGDLIGDYKTVQFVIGWSF